MPCRGTVVKKRRYKMKKRLISAVLSAVMLFDVSAFAASEFSPAIGFAEQLETEDGITYPEAVPDELLSDTEKVCYSDEEIYGTDEKSFEDYYITYFQIITGNETEIAKLDTYYAENISETDTTAEDILGKVFTAEEAAAPTAESEGLEIYKLLVCILTDDRVSDAEI